MDNKLLAVFVTIALGGFLIIGDYFIKIASYHDKPIATKAFYIGALIYMLSTFVWVYLFKYLKLSTIGVVYSVSTVLFLTLLGIFVFNEALNNYEFAGIALAIVSILLLTKFA
ncbi:MAG: EamA family transporter [Thermodesulfobacteriota bacterium]